MSSRVDAGQLLMQYRIGLPADYDMAIIRERVRIRGSALDERAGLNCKAYCIRERHVDGSTVNEYAPFYLWDDAGAAADFLWGGEGFDGIVRDFGRPAVHTWVPTAFEAGPAQPLDVTHALLRTQQIASDADLVAAAGRLRDHVAAQAADPLVHLAFAGIDPTTWHSVEFSIMTSPKANDAPASGTLLTVLHLSRPSTANPPRAAQS